MILPANLADVGSMVALVTNVLKGGGPGAPAPPVPAVPHAAPRPAGP
jgi:hypothetical protein